jgi:hypothetical protein
LRGGIGDYVIIETCSGEEYREIAAAQKVVTMESQPTRTQAGKPERRKAANTQRS